MLTSLLDDESYMLLIGSFRARLWSRWNEYARDHPDEAFTPRRISDEDASLEVWVLAPNEPDFPGMVVIHPWRVPRDGPERICLQPPPYVMAESVEAARALLPPSATSLAGVPLVDRYLEAWLV